MKYDPELINKYPGIWKNRKTLGKYLNLVKFNPDKKRYYCTICNKQYLTDTGASNHVDANHEKEILNIIK